MAISSYARAFFPRNRPRFWVVGATAWLLGFIVGLIGFGVATLDLVWLQIPLMAVFALCWLVGVVCWFGYVHGIFSGRYRGITEKPWREQVW